jgi:hypothetical protein
MMFRHGWAFALLLAAAGAGCSGSPTGLGPRDVASPTLSSNGKPVKGPHNPPDRSADGSSGKPSGRPDNPAVSATGEAGVISGFVQWDGPLPPAAPEEPRAGDRTVTVGGRKLTVTPTPRVVADPKTGGLANTVVWLDNPPPQDSRGGNRPGARPAGPASLVQRHGNYHPHVQAVRRGSLLELGTGDDQADFHIDAATFSVRLERGEKQSIRLSSTGLVEVRSDLNQWMTPAYIHVLDHSYHAVTGADGRFRLPAVPPGAYRLMLWHEGVPDPKTPLGGAPREAHVTVKVGVPPEGAGAEVRWTLPGP